MMNSRLGALAWGIAGVLFAAYPIVRPYTEDETSMAGAEALASAAWLVSHTLAMVAFVLLLPGMLALRRAHISTGRALGAAIVLTWLGAAAVLPYYGAETFALAQAGEQALATGDTGVLVAIEAFRWAPLPMTLFGAGLLALAAAGALLIRATWTGGVLARWGGLITGIGLVTYLPQFFLPAAGRIGHGVLLGAGLVLLAVWLTGRDAPAVNASAVHASASGHQGGGGTGGGAGP